MRTAEEIIKHVFASNDPHAAITELYIIAINEARTEAIKEAAEQVDNFVFPKLQLRHDLRADILSLINQIK